MMPYNILFISHASDNGGAEQCLFDLVSRINRQKFNIYVNTPYYGILTERLNKQGIPAFVSFTDQWIPPNNKRGYKHLFSFIAGLRSRVWSIQTKIEMHNIDLVYSNSITCIDGAIAAWRMGIPHIWHIHENITKNYGIKSYLPTRLTYKVTKFICKNFITPSKELANSLTAQKTKVYTIYNGVDLKKFIYKDTHNLKTELGLSASAQIIGQIGSIIPVKGISTFIAAAEKVLATTLNKELAFVLVGSGPEEYTACIQDKLANSPFQHHFFLLRHREDIPQLLNAFNLLVVASDSEGFSRVTIEAMATGKPVVATRCGGPEEIIIDEETGFLVPIKDAHSIADKVMFLLDHPEQAQAMGTQGRLRAQSMFSMDQYVQNIEKVIIETINSVTMS